MNTLRITLRGSDGYRFTKYVRTDCRNTATENELRVFVQNEVNQDDYHKACGPWTVISSGWE